jgi:hypothetical protein
MRMADGCKPDCNRPAASNLAKEFTARFYLVIGRTLLKELIKEWARRIRTLIKSGFELVLHY